ncbi:MAG: N-acetylmuramoyl-L-alanine amidase [Chloroflexi bacterium]|nr:N-acetylmuramoyl-L-alanine amidase [Chloroflexota bacterium]
MHHALRLVGVAVLAGSIFLAPPSRVTAQAPVQSGKIVFSTAADWQRGTRSGVQVIANADGELRLSDGATRGTFLSEPISTTTTLNAVGVVWHADVPPGTSLSLEVRGNTGDGQFGAWQPIVAGELRARATPDALAAEAVRSLPPDTRVVQFNVTLSSTAANASPLLSDISITYFNTMAGPPRAVGPVSAVAGPATLTPPPLVYTSDRWAGGDPRAYRGPRAAPQGIVLHQVGADTIDDPLPFLRALAAYQETTLGLSDIAYHYVIGRDGAIFEGRSGGPTATVAELSGGAAVHVALIGDAAPATAQLDALHRLLAWLGEAYNIAPTGQRVVAVSGASVVTPAIAAHSDVAPGAGDPSGALRNALPQIRRAADGATVRSRWYFAEGNPRDYEERLAVFNPGTAPATVRFIMLRQPGPEVVRETTVAPGARENLVVNQVFNDAPDAPAIIEANAPVIAERFMDFGNDMTVLPGVTRTSRVWYFAEGSTEGDRRTFLLLFNPQHESVTARVLLIQNDGTTFIYPPFEDQPITLPPRQRSVVILGDLLPEASFGMRVIASQPVVAERTMIFGPGSSLTSGGVHTAPGITELSRAWYFAEGTTAPPFRMSLLVLNPNGERANVTVRFLTADGTSLARRYAIPPMARLAINVNEVVPELGVATTIVSDRPVAAERALYWRDGAAGTAGPGATAPAYTWSFADGRTSGDYQQFLLISNPARGQARIEVAFILADGTSASRALVMPPGSRYTMAVHELFPNQTSITATLRATQPVVVERSVYAGPPAAAGSRGGETALGVAGD